MTLDEHLAPEDVASYVDGTTDAGVRARIEGHLAACLECRDEVADASRVVATLPRRNALHSRWYVAAAAAALVVMVAWPRGTGDELHREPPVAATVAPRALLPIGVVDSTPVFVWSAVPGSDGYKVIVFDDGGSVVWQRETSDTLARLDSVSLSRDKSYYWKVEARSGFGRTVATDLIEFSMRRRR